MDTSPYKQAISHIEYWIVVFVSEFHRSPCCFVYWASNHDTLPKRHYIIAIQYLNLFQIVTLIYEKVQKSPRSLTNFTRHSSLLNGCSRWLLSVSQTCSLCNVSISSYSPTVKLIAFFYSDPLVDYTSIMGSAFSTNEQFYKFYHVQLHANILINQHTDIWDQVITYKLSYTGG